MKLILLALLLSPTAHASIVERRIWIETAIDTLKEDMCQDKRKEWRCLFPDRAECIKAMKGVFPTCAGNVVPDLPEYIEGQDTKDQANKVVTDCMSTELAKKYVLPLSKERMDEYNICTGSVARNKPMNPSLLKALDASHTMTASTCATGSFFRKCFSLQERDCKEKLEKQGIDCTMKMEQDGAIPKAEDAAIQETSRKITECVLAGIRKTFEGSRPKGKDKDCE